MAAGLLELLLPDKLPCHALQTAIAVFLDSIDLPVFARAAYLLWSSRASLRLALVRSREPEWAVLIDSIAGSSGHLAQGSCGELLRLGEECVAKFRRPNLFYTLSCKESGHTATQRELVATILALQPWRLLEIDTQQGEEDLVLETLKCSPYSEETPLILSLLTAETRVTLAATAVERWFPEHGCFQCGGRARCARPRCGGMETFVGQFFKCRRCSVVRYCSLECRHKHWSMAHENECGHEENPPEVPVHGRSLCSDCAVKRRDDVATYSIQANRILEQVDRRSFSEVRAFSKPPPRFLVIAEAVCLLLRERVGRTGEVWRRFSQLLVDRNTFIARLVSLVTALADGQLDWGDVKSAKSLLLNGIASSPTEWFDELRKVSDLAAALGRWAALFFAAAEVVPPIPARHFTTATDFLRINSDAAIQAICRETLSSFSVQILAVLASFSTFEPEPVLANAKLSGSSCAVALDLMHQLWMRTAMLGGPALADLLQAWDADEEHILELASCTRPDSVGFAALWVVCGVADGRGVAARHVLSSWSRLLPYNEVAEVVAGTRLELPQPAASDVAWLVPSSHGDVEAAALQEVLLAPWLAGLPLHPDLPSDIFERRTLTVPIVRVLRLATRGLSPTEVSASLSQRRPCLIAHDSRAIVELLQWCDEMMEAEPCKTKFVPLLLQVLHGLVQTRAERSDRYAPAHTRQAVESVAVLLHLYPTLARGLVCVDSDRDPPPRLSALQLLCLRCEVVDRHTITIAKLLARQAPEMYAKTLPRAFRKQLAVGNASSALKRRKEEAAEASRLTSAESAAAAQQHTMLCELEDALDGVMLPSLDTASMGQTWKSLGLKQEDLPSPPRNRTNTAPRPLGAETEHIGAQRKSIPCPDATWPRKTHERPKEIGLLADLDVLPSRPPGSLRPFSHTWRVRQQTAEHCRSAF